EALAGVPSGEGDAHIHCDDTNVCVHLGSPADRAHVVLPREEVDAFAEASTNLIPRGAESTHLDLDGLISRILASTDRSEEHTSALQSRENLVCCLLLEKRNLNKQESIRQI